MLPQFISQLDINNIGKFFLTRLPYNIPSYWNMLGRKIVGDKKGNECCLQAIAIEGGTYWYLQQLDIISKESFNYTSVFFDKNVAFAQTAHYVGCTLKEPVKYTQNSEQNINGITFSGIGGGVKYALKNILNKAREDIAVIYNTTTNEFFKGSINSVIYSIEDYTKESIENLFFSNHDITKLTSTIQYLVPVFAEAIDEHLNSNCDKTDVKCLYDNFVSSLKVSLSVILAIEAFYQDQDIKNICTMQDSLTLPWYFTDGNYFPARATAGIIEHHQNCNVN